MMKARKLAATAALDRINSRCSAYMQAISDCGWTLDMEIEEIGDSEEATRFTFHARRGVEHHVVTARRASAALAQLRKATAAHPPAVWRNTRKHWRLWNIGRSSPTALARPTGRGA